MASRLSCLVLIASATPASSSIARAAVTAFKVPITTVRWNLENLINGRTPMRLGVDVEVRENSMGRGLYALRTLEAESLVGRYTGAHIDGKRFEEGDWDGLYAMTLANGDIVDAANPRSNFVRYVNHSKRKANCQACDAWVDTDPLNQVAHTPRTTVHPLSVRC